MIHMKKIKRILAVTGALLLAGMYVSTLVFALIKSPAALAWLKASVACTILFPVMLYGYIIVYRVLNGKPDKEEPTAQKKDPQ